MEGDARLAAAEDELFGGLEHDAMAVGRDDTGTGAGILRVAGLIRGGSGWER